jgi:hypothetical protein
MNKDKALFWLNRRIKELEAKGAPPSQEEMAKQGVTYSDRQSYLAAAEVQKNNAEGELSSFKELYVFVAERA